MFTLSGGYDIRGDLFGGDYSSFWAASRMVRLGQAPDVYMESLHQLAELPILRHGYEAFYYPPTYLLLCIPLTILPFFYSLAFFLSASGAAFIAVIWRILRTPWAIIAVLAFPAVYINVLPGQNAFVIAAVLGVGLGLLDRRPGLAGAILGLMAIKPHLALAVPVALVVTGRWRPLLFATVSACSLTALACAVFGWSTMLAFLTNSPEARETLEQGYVGFQKMQSAFVVARLLGASIPSAYAAHALVALGAICGLSWSLWRQPTGPLARSLTVIACLLVSPFSLFYDMVMVGLPLAWMLKEWLDHGFPPWSKPILCLVFVSPASYLAMPAPFGFPALVLLGGFLVSLVRAQSRSELVTYRSRLRSSCEFWQGM
jgi:hypothetical protein